jgi:hypothetical protein
MLYAPVQPDSGFAPVLPPAPTYLSETIRRRRVQA